MKDLGAATAYAYAVEEGYTGTEEEFAALMADFTTAAETATAAAEAAEAAAASLTVDDELDDESTNPVQNAVITSELSDLKEDISQVIDSAYVTDTASGSIASFPDGADNMPVKSLKVNIEPVQSGSGDPSPDNVRPISGHTSAVVTRTGFNVWDEEWQIGDIDIATGQNKSSQLRLRSSYISVKPNTAYYICIDITQTTSWFFIFFYDSNKNYLGNITPNKNTVNSTPTNTAYIRFVIPDGWGGADYVGGISINYPSTDHDYHAYTGEVYEIDLDGTRYGGMLDVTTGVLTVDRVIATLDGTQTISVANWRATSTSVAWLYPYSVFNNKLYSDGGDVSNTVADRLVTCGYTNMYNGTYDNSIAIVSGSAKNFSFAVRVGDTSLTTVSLINAYLANNPITVVYPIAEPFEVQLTAQEVTTLKGQNNIWNDCGDVEVEYRADTKLYIEKLTAPTEDDMIADANIVSGQYFMVGNTLYKATANIASGGAITPNVNCTRKSLPEALNEINA